MKPSGHGGPKPTSGDPSDAPLVCCPLIKFGFSSLPVTDLMQISKFQTGSNLKKTERETRTEPAAIGLQQRILKADMRLLTVISLLGVAPKDLSNGFFFFFPFAF